MPVYLCMYRNYLLSNPCSLQGHLQITYSSYIVTSATTTVYICYKPRNDSVTVAYIHHITSTYGLYAKFTVESIPHCSLRFEFELVSMTVVPFSNIKLMNSLCIEFVAGGTLHHSVPLNISPSCAFLNWQFNELRIRR